MSDETPNSDNEDGVTDAISATLIVVLPVMAVVYWLSGLPTS